MTLFEAIQRLEELGSAQDPIEHRSGAETPDDLLGRPDLHDGSRAARIRIGYMSSTGWRRGTLTGMIKDREELSERRSRVYTRPVPRCPHCGKKLRRGKACPTS